MGRKSKNNSAHGTALLPGTGPARNGLFGIGLDHYHSWFAFFARFGHALNHMKIIAYNQRIGFNAISMYKQIFIMLGVRCT